MHGNAHKQRAEGTFGGVENFGGAILGAQKIWISGGVCCIFAVAKSGCTSASADEKTNYSY